jgi:Flp pilus assembly protein TadG
MNRIQLRHRARQEDGQSLIEFALTSVLFFMMVFGIIEFGLAIWQYNMVSDLAQEGARWAVVRGSSSTLLPTATSTELQNYVQSRSPGFTVTVTATPADPSSAGPGTPISVQVTSSFSPVSALIPTTTLNLTSTATMIVQR